MATLAPALAQLRAQIDARFPTRSKASDGWIGDAAHAARGSAAASQHNPNTAGVVCAIDVTEDLAVGLDCNRLMDELDAGNDPRIFYLIHDRHIDNSDDSRTPYTGPNPHTKHLHVSTWWNRPERYTDARPWAVPMLTGQARPAPAPATPTRPARPVLRRGATGPAVAAVQNRLTHVYPAYRHKLGALVVDGVFGPRTDAWVREFQRRSRLRVDGIVGPRTSAALGLA